MPQRAQAASAAPRPGRGSDALVGLSEAQRALALERYALLQPHLDDGVPLACVARAAGVPLRTAQRWLARYRADGLAGLVRGPRADRGRRRMPTELLGLIEGLALRKPKPTVAAIHRRVAVVAVVAAAQGWPAPSYSTVHAVVAELDPAMVTLAQQGQAAFRDRYELVYRRRAERPNAIWQADHTELDLLVLDANGTVVRPWLTTVLDDHSRAIAGYAVFLGAPSALQTSLALRQAIWRKADPAWSVCGIPEVLYVDHGSDFTSRHLDQVAADLRVQLVYSTVGRPLLTG